MLDKVYMYRLWSGCVRKLDVGKKNFRDYCSLNPARFWPDSDVSITDHPQLVFIFFSFSPQSNHSSADISFGIVFLSGISFVVVVKFRQAVR